eukprot:1006375_1
MAEGASSESSRKEPTKDVWAFRLFQNPEMATTLCCVQCGHPPKKCFVNNDNLLLCELHAEELIQKGNKINAQPFADGLISNAKIICPNILFDPSKNDDEKKEEPKQCEHKCLIKNWSEHNTTTCPYTIIDCQTCHSDFNASRCLQEEHNKICDHVIIECEQKCDHKILRKDLVTHKANDCPETILNCTNQTCSQKIARKLFTQHVNNTCVKRIVECKYKTYGCPQENVKFEDMEQHMKLFETKHLQFHMNALFVLVTQQQQRLQEDSEPIGMIRMFGGIDIPNGYVLCDGQNGTPDLRKKFELRGNEHGNVNDDFDVDQISECEMDDDNNDVVPSYSMVYIMKS